MNRVKAIDEVYGKDLSLVGGKGAALAGLYHAGFKIPETLFVTASAYHEFLDTNGLKERISMELNRKSFDEMRWEEIWDCSARIRNMVLGATMSAAMKEEISFAIERTFSGQSVVVRSSGTEEDSEDASFAGLHDSFVNIKGGDAIISHVIKVWASLFSDAALLYRKEIGLDLKKSAMAVVIQELIVGEKSGVAFSKSFNDFSEGIVEAVHGLNQGLVDGGIEPDRWTMDRHEQSVIKHRPAKRTHYLVPDTIGVKKKPLPENLKKKSPLAKSEAKRVLELALSAQNYFEEPQDVEWTIRKKELILLQSRPISGPLPMEITDKRGWYLTLKRSLENLKLLRKKIEKKVIPGMIEAADAYGDADLSSLSDSALKKELLKRWDTFENWKQVYADECIPFAHGVRLFGQVYNEMVKPEDPYEFVILLTNTRMISLDRNRALLRLARMIQEDITLKKNIEQKKYDTIPSSFSQLILEFTMKYPGFEPDRKRGCAHPVSLYRFLLNLAESDVAETASADQKMVERLRQKYLDAFEKKKRKEALGLLDLARSSYQLRDDDNIFLGRIEDGLKSALREGEARLEKKAIKSPKSKSALEDLINALKDREKDHEIKEADPRVLAKITKAQLNGEREKAESMYALLKGMIAFHQKSEKDFDRSDSDSTIGVLEEGVTAWHRQIVGQPAGPGLAIGPARIIFKKEDLYEFKAGEVLVCDAVDPTMTFVIPLAKGVVERRGGMLIHGAIIAREYGLPCITGIVDATTRIQNGDMLTVDGFLGILTIDRDG